jgi:hypothetical protein
VILKKKIQIKALPADAATSAWTVEDLLSWNGTHLSERIENLRSAIETMHRCKAKHEQSVVIVEKFGNFPNRRTNWLTIAMPDKIVGLQRRD